jgi:two-component sensor histidine kinase
MSDARESLAARFDALGKSIDILAPSGWTRGSLLEVVKQTLQLSQSSEQVSFEGPNLIVEGRVISTIAMAIHELQTNALKHGALSNDSGAVELFWKVVQSGSGPKLWMQWSEKGGPSVERKPEPGFGTRLLSSVTARALSGETILDYDRGGLNWLLIAPLDKITPTS